MNANQSLWSEATDVLSKFLVAIVLCLRRRWQAAGFRLIDIPATPRVQPFMRWYPCRNRREVRLIRSPCWGLRLSAGRKFATHRCLAWQRLLHRAIDTGRALADAGFVVAGQIIPGDNAPIEPRGDGRSTSATDGYA